VRPRGKRILNIQPVIPFRLNEEWNLITRWILPVVYPTGSCASRCSSCSYGRMMSAIVAG